MMPPPNTVTATILTYLKRPDGSAATPIPLPLSQLDPHLARLIAHFSAHPPRTLKEARIDPVMIMNFEEKKQQKTTDRAYRTGLAPRVCHFADRLTEDVQHCDRDY